MVPFGCCARAQGCAIYPSLKYGSGQQGIPQDYSEAVKWYRLAAEMGSAGAQANLGMMYIR